MRGEEQSEYFAIGDTLIGGTMMVAKCVYMHGEVARYLQLILK